MKIRVYLVLLATAVTVPVIMVSGWALNTLDASGRSAALRSMHETARASKLAVDRELYASQVRLRVLATSPDLVTGDLRALHDSMTKASRPPADGWLVLLDESGKQLINTRAPLGTVLGPLASRDQMNTLFEMKAPFVSNLVRGPVSGKLQVGVAIPVQLENGKRYALAEVLTPALFDRLLSEGGIPASWTQALFDRDGKFIARSHDPANMLGKLARPELIDASRREHAGQIRHHIWEGVESYDVFNHTQWGNWTMAVAAPVEEIDGAGRRATKIIASGFLGALLLAGFAVWIFGRRLVTSLDRAAQASAMLVRGEVPPLTDSSVAEMRELQRALYRAAELISKERASRHVAELERERLLEVEQGARLLAEEESKSKDAFLAMLGHELRNPLSAISAGIAVIRGAEPGSQTAQRANEIIARQSAHLERIVDDLLDSARMLAGKITLVKVPLNLADAVQSCVDALRASGRIDGYTVRLQTLPLLVDADPARIDQIINNLLTNALKYTPPGGTIDIAMRKEDERAVLEIRDNGIGMQPDLLARIFDPFVQGAVSLDRAQGGLGIGLTLVKSLVDLHGGTVSAHSAGQGAGSCFTVRLPLLREGYGQVPATAAPVGQEGVYVLLVEDNTDAREMTAELLRLAGYKVTAVASGQEALEVAREQAYLVAVIDIGLPDLSGYDVARQLRLWPQTRQMGLIALTGYGLVTDLQNAKAAGFDMHLAKPVNYPRLVESIEKVLAAQSQSA